MSICGPWRPSFEFFQLWDFLFGVDLFLVSFFWVQNGSEAPVLSRAKAALEDQTLTGDPEMKDDAAAAAAVAPGENLQPNMGFDMGSVSSVLHILMQSPYSRGNVPAIAFLSKEDSNCIFALPGRCFIVAQRVDW